MLKTGTWRVLFVKCFSLLLFIYCSLLFAQDATKINVIESIHRVLPLEAGKNNIENNEIYEVRVESDLKEEELLKLQNKKINDVMYVIDVFFDGDDKFFRVFVAEPPKDKEKQKIDPYFDRTSFSYKYVKKQKPQDFLSFEKDFTVKEFKAFWQKYAIYIFIILLLIPMPYFIYKGYFYFLSSKQSRKEKLRIKKLSKDLVTLFEEASTREDFENIFAKRKLYKRYIETDHQQFNKLLQKIDDFQYQKDWSDIEVSEIKKIKNKVGPLRVSRGV